MLGRLTADAMTTLGSGVSSSAMRRIMTSYNTQGLVRRITSYDAASGGNVVNQVQRAYNGLGQLTREYQAHDGAVDTATTPWVGYAYSEMAGGANHSRPTSMTYPNGRVLNYNYASGTGAAGVDDRISRLSSISDASATLESLTYLGLSTVVRRVHAQPGVDLTYVKLTGEPNGDSQDQYAGLDRFGRVVDQRWVSSGSSGTVDRFAYGHDRNGNRLYKENKVDPTRSELYAYDGLDRLTDMQRGTLNGTKTGLTGAATRSQRWSLDALGNSDSVTTDGTTEARAHNAQNQLTDMGTNALAFDANGNVTTDQTGKTFVYDAWNRLVEVKDGGTTLIRYEHDGAGRRVQENATALYYSAQWQVIEERESGIALVQRVWSPVYVDAAVATDRDGDGNGTLDERSYVLQDANFNVTALTNVTGSVIERYLYDAYGKRTVLDANWATDADGASDVLNRQGHQGGLIDRVVAYHVNFRNRIFDVDQMRWTQQDPAGYVDGATLYGAFLQNPVRFLDAYGLACGECQPPVAPYPNEYNKRVTAVRISPGGANPATIDAGFDILENLDMIDDLSGLAGIMGALSQGGLEAYQELISELAENGADVSGLAPGVIQNFMNAVQGTHGFGVFLKVEFDACVECTSLNPFNWGGCPEYEWEAQSRWHQCTQGSYQGGGIYGGQMGYPLPSPASINACRQEALQ